MFLFIYVIYVQSKSIVANLTIVLFDKLSESLDNSILVFQIVVIKLKNMYSL